jgi:phosphoenolpyruvate synthase/pyruvate phosphate dikinase
MPDLIDIEKGAVCSTTDVELLGGKAYQQALAAADNLPVLRGLTLTTDVFPGRLWLQEQAGKSSAQQAEAVREHLKHRGVDLVAALRRVTGSRFAFRSSGNAEDSEPASFAGSFVSKLNVRPEGCFSAIYEVWASTFTERVRQYMSNRGLAGQWETLKMAVLIQPMVSPLLSGVALSHPPGKPDDPNILLTMVRGLGERLVGGAEPQSYSLERGTWAIVEQRDAIDTEIVYEAAAEIGRIIEFLELRRGAGQDIELAIDWKYELTLLQNRSISKGSGERPTPRASSDGGDHSPLGRPTNERDQG